MRKIAIVRRNGLGDLLLIIPLLYALKKECESAITLFVDERNAPLIPYLPPLFEECVVLPKKGNKYLHLIKVAWKNRKKKFDIAISSKTSPMKFMNFFLFALGAKRRIAFVDHSLSSLLINEKVSYDPHFCQKTHQALKVLKLIGKAELSENWYPSLHIKEESLKKFSVPFPQGPVILMAATTTNCASRIDPLKYASAINRLAENFSFSVLLIAEKKDQKRLSLIAKNLKVPHRCRIPDSFEEFMVLQEQADLNFIPDGGIAHIGAGLSKRQVVLFGSTPPLLWRPLSHKALVLFHENHIDQISDEDIDNALKSQISEVLSGRAHR